MNDNKGRPWSFTGLPGVALAIVFVTAAALPLLSAWVSRVEPAGLWAELGTGFGLTGAALLFLQFLSSGRYEILSGRVGIDRTMGFHRIAAYALLTFAVLHPLTYLAPTLIAEPEAAVRRLGAMLTSNRLRTGVVALAGLILLVGFATVRSRPFVRYEYWRVSHGLVAIVVAGLTVHHAIKSGTYSAEPLLEFTWLLFTAAAIVAVLLVYVVRPWRMWREHWRVEDVRPLADHVWEMILHGPDTTRLRFRAGQFIWMTLAPNRPPFHDHPFSIASAPSKLPRLRLVIGEAGDCTSGFSRIEPGRRVAIDGPHGSFVLPQGEMPVLMIAGGVGIAPILGMLEEAAANADRRPFRLLYAARRPSTLAALKRLGEFTSHLDLTITYLVDQDVRAPNFMQGPLRGQHISDLLSGVTPRQAVCLVCGPSRMMEVATDALLAAGVPAANIYYERFDYAAGRGQLDRLRQRQALLVFVALLAAIAVFAVR